MTKLVKVGSPGWRLMTVRVKVGFATMVELLEVGVAPMVVKVVPMTEWATGRKTPHYEWDLYAVPCT